MIVIVCGGRDYLDRQHVSRVLDQLRPLIASLVQGECPTGADRWAREWAAERGVPCVGYRAEWERYGKRAGPIRNRAMRDESGATLTIAFPGGSGTENMVDLFSGEYR